MIVAEIELLTTPSLSWINGRHNIRFDCLETAQAEYRRIADLLERKQKKANDLPTMLEVIGSGEKTIFPLADLCAVTLRDYNDSDRQRSGLKEAFPNLF